MFLGICWNVTVAMSALISQLIIVRNAAILVSLTAIIALFAKGL